MIKVSQLRKQFDSRGIAGLHGLSLSLSKGEVLGILGPNGSGKTTLINLICGNLLPDSGSVETEGEVSVFPSKTQVQNQNVQKFLINSIHLDISDEKKIQLARDLADTFEFTFQLRQSLDELSSGQKQKVMLARELINRPALLLMDEPFAHLDPFSRTEILNSLFKYIKQQEISVLWVTHDLNEAFKFSDKIGLLNFGKIEQLDTPHEIIQNPRNLFVAQFAGYRNFFPVKIEKSHWMSLWGPLSFPVTDKDEAILVIPDRAWTIGSNGTSCTVIEKFANVQSLEYKLQLGEKVVHWQRAPHLELLELGSQVNLSPLIEECFLIPL